MPQSYYDDPQMCNSSFYPSSKLTSNCPLYISTWKWPTDTSNTCQNWKCLSFWSCSSYFSVSGTTKPGTWELSLILLFLLYSIHSVINVNYKHCLILLLSPWLLNTKFRPSIHLHHQQLYWSFAPSLSSSNPPSTQHWGSLIKTKINNQLLIVLTM